MPSDYEACRLAMEALEEAYSAVFAVAREGMTADEVDALLLGRLEPRGAQLLPPRSTPFVVAENGAPPKLRLNRLPLRRGALWGMDNTVAVSGYHADLGRYGYFGAAPPALRRAHEEVLKRQDAIAAEVRPGRSAREIFEAIPGDMPFEVHRIATEPSMLPMFGNATAGLAKSLEETERQGLVFEPGQVVCIEIWAGLRGGIEDMYVVEAGGVRRISTLPRAVREIPERNR